MKDMKINSAETTNPVIDTARLTISQLAAAGVPEAVNLAGIFGFQDFMSNYQVSGEKISPLAVVQEARYSFINRSVESSGLMNVMDLGCGFSPRGLVMARKDRNYLGCDLESATRAMSEIADKVSAAENLPGRFGYRLTDITDPLSVKEAAASMDGKILMCCEGLLIYFGTYEYESMINSISTILHEHGGYFVTPDLVTARFMAGIFMALLGKEEGMKAMLAIGRSIEKKSDTKLTGSISDMPMEQMQELFKKYDLAYEFVPFFPEGAQMHSFESLTPEQIENVRRNLAGIQCLKLTAGEKRDRDQAGTSDKYSAEITCNAGRMYIRLAGRLDSVTAPVLLEEYTKAAGEDTATDITIDASGLDYISSAGLRTLLIMQKRLKEKKLRFRGAQEVVLNILKQTGFYDLFDTAR